MLLKDCYFKNTINGGLQLDGLGGGVVALELAAQVLHKPDPGLQKGLLALACPDIIRNYKVL